MLSVQIFVFASVVVAGVVGTVTDSDWSWSTSIPEECPSHNDETHVCTDIYRMTGVCIEVDCCESGEFDSEVDDGTIEEADNVDYKNSTKTCTSVCMTIRYCTVYKCVSYCCDGYEKDEYGRCITKTDSIQCENGGTPMRHHGEWKCFCPWNYTGMHCEIERCQCKNGARCLPGGHHGRPQCICETGYYGEYCEHQICTMDCQNGGSCFISNDDAYEPRQFCKCRTGYTGRHCEMPYSNSRLCPAMNRTSDSVTCVPECSSDDECAGDNVCCSEGCTLVCRSPTTKTCRAFNGHIMANGETYKPDPCTTCTCEEGFDKAMCFSISCAYPECTAPSKPVTKPGECCMSCEDAGPVKIKDCPKKIITINTDKDSSGVKLTSANTGISAIDTTTGHSLEPRFVPSFLPHCKCRDIYKTPRSVMVYFGNTDQCGFQVAVNDVEPPYTTSCPKDIYAFEDESVGWRIPRFSDNVGIADLWARPASPGPHKFPAGTRFRAYIKAMDFSGNTAQCSFSVDIRSRDSNVADLPQGLRERSTGDNSWILKILVPALAVLILIVLLVILMICCRRKMMSTDRRPSARRQSSLATENIYAVPGDISVKLPSYNDVAFNPPPYTMGGSMKDVTYTSLPPPSYVSGGDAKSAITQASGSYANPVYDTVSEKP